MSSIINKLKNALFETDPEEIFQSIEKIGKEMHESVKIFKDAQLTEEQVEILEDEILELRNNLAIMKKLKNRKTTQGKLMIPDTVFRVIEVDDIMKFIIIL